MSGSSEDFRMNVTAHDGATATLAKIRGELGAISKVGSTLKTAFAGFLALQGVQEVGSLLKSSLDNFAEAEAAQIQLQRVLKTTGGQAGVTAAEIAELAEATMMSTKFDDDVTLQAAAQLARFKNISGPLFKETLMLSQDMATVLGQDLSSAAEMLGKALSDPTEGLSKLKRAGVMLGEDKEDLVKFFQETGDAASAQAVIMAELRKQFEGAASAEQDTFGGQLAKMNNLIGELKESIGEQLAPVVVDLLKNINVFLGGTSPERAKAKQIREREINSKGELRLEEYDKKIKDQQDALAELNDARGDLIKQRGNAATQLMPGVNDKINQELDRMEREANTIRKQIESDKANRFKVAEQAMIEQDDINAKRLQWQDKKAADEQAKIKKKTDDDAAREAEKIKRAADRAEKQKLRDDIDATDARADEIRKQLKGEFGDDRSLSATESRFLTRGTGNINDQVRQDRLKQQRTLEAMLDKLEKQLAATKELLKKKEIDVNVVGAN
jgi:hypothetical protein